MLDTRGTARLATAAGGARTHTAPPGAAPGSVAGADGAAAAPSVVTFEVAHQIGRRIRLRIPRLAHDPPFVRRLSDSVATVPDLEHARISPRSSSLVATFRSAPPAAPAGGRRGPSSGPATASLPRLVERIRVAAGADLALDVAPGPRVKAYGPLGAGPAAAWRADYTNRLRLPALGLGLSAAAVAGLAVPGLLVGGVILTAALPIFRRTAQGIREERRLPVDLLDALTIVLLTAQGTFLVPAFVVGVIEGSEILRDMTARRRPELGLSLLLSPQRPVLVERAGGSDRRSWDGVVRGDVVLVRRGDRIQVDGTVLEGEGLVDEHQLTGVAAPLRRRRGDRVKATTLLVQGALRVRATRTGYETRAAGLMAQARPAPDADTRVSNHARRVGNPAVGPTLALAAGVWATSGSVARATGIVSLDLGTGMRVSAPVAVLSAQANAARHGILIRSGRALERLARAESFVFDKTATLTTGRMRVVDVRAVAAGTPPGDVLLLAASAAGALDHPLARAVAACARERGIVPLSCGSRRDIAGEGVVAEIEGQRVYVGNGTLMARAGIEVGVGDGRGSDRGTAPDGASLVYVARERELAGVIRCQDALRPESAGVVAELRRRGHGVYLVTGDHRGAAAAAAAALELPPQRVCAGALPGQKAMLVEAIRDREGPVAVIGDGVNDAAAMARADVSVSFGGATGLAREAADVVLLRDDLGDLLVALAIARDARRILEQNRSVVVVSNVAAMAYGAVAVLNPVAGAVINNGSALVAAVNSLRPLDGPGGRAVPERVAGPPAGDRSGPRQEDE